MKSLNDMFPSWIKIILYKTISKYRLLTWQYRGLPDFIVIGAQKSGTSSLYYYLGQHAQLKSAYEKEVHFFDGGLNSKVDNYQKGEPWYRSHFPLYRNTGMDQKIFEGSPFYIFNPLVPKRIAEFLPEAKLIAILRNPTERAISHYFHEKRKGRESLPIMDALQAEEERLKAVIENKDYKNEIYKNYSYKSRGLYYNQIKRYLDYFQMNNILVINSEKLFLEPDSTLRRIFQFVGVDAELMVRDLKPRNVANNRTEVESCVYDYLENYFRPHNQMLYKLIGENYGW